MMSDCLFCKIVNGIIPSNKVHESEHFIAFHDISPQAKTHVLVIPKKHVSNLVDATERLESEQLANFLKEIAVVANKLGVVESGFRVAMNTNADGCQTVFHLHAHILGGEPLSGAMC